MLIKPFYKANSLLFPQLYSPLPPTLLPSSPNSTPLFLRNTSNLTPPSPPPQYLRHGCTQYFCGKESQARLSSNSPSKAHSAKGALKDPILDDVKNFASLDKALGNLGIGGQERLAIYTSVAAVLHLGNILFEDDPEDAKGGFLGDKGGALRTTPRTLKAGGA